VVGVLVVGGRAALLPLTPGRSPHPRGVVVVMVSGVALVLHHALHPEVVLDVLLDVDVAEALADMGPVLRLLLLVVWMMRRKAASSGGR